MGYGGGDDGIHLVDRAGVQGRWEAGSFEPKLRWRRRVGAGIQGKEKAPKRSHATVAAICATAFVSGSDQTALVAHTVSAKYNPLAIIQNTRHANSSLPNARQAPFSL
jgi:hypothetical protein